MFKIEKDIINWNDSLYAVKRMIKESTIKEDMLQEYKEYLGVDSILKKNGCYFFVEKIEEAQLIEENQIELEKPSES